MASAAEAHRALLRALNANTAQSAMRLWPLLDFAALDATFPGWRLAMGALIERNRLVAAQSAAEWLAAERVRAGIAGTFPAITPDLEPDQLETSLRVTGPVWVKRGLGSGMDAETARRNALVAVVGAATRMVLDGARDTVTATTIADPAALGWRRTGSGKSCEFCRMLIGRGEVYRESTASFAAHDHCSCLAAPAYDGAKARNVGAYRQSQRRARMSDEQRATDNERAREWIADNRDN